MTFDLFLISVYSATQILNYGRFSPVPYTASPYVHSLSATQIYTLKFNQNIYISLYSYNFSPYFLWQL